MADWPKLMMLGLAVELGGKQQRILVLVMDSSTTRLGDQLADQLASQLV